ncbi:low molecular weight protein arginine phosphatase [Staphylococcus sp. 30400_3112M30941]|nr:low molecular weight protein arginine phosphatase [Staphylococcus sp. 30403_3112M30944]MBO0946792.1 low molecular weight protein arginine phosphatase [Staphylococcus sp. 30402_3112M30943]MBO0965342.1 low molecular weight protein arginine phosphatase [Staphylococcus sp. 30400_3112M30941]MBO0967876.1 low molecular weight protein arginine phosphatase [Staphylococcus sp. 30401_3112M30942]
MNIIFVCTGNTCRSPLAESIAKEIMPNEHFESRGLFALDNQEVARHAIDIIHEYNLVEPTLSQQFSEQDLKADIILTMSRSHKEVIFTQYGFQDNVYTLHEYVKEVGEVVDPYGGSREIYQYTYDELTKLILKLKEIIC